MTRAKSMRYPREYYCAYKHSWVDLWLYTRLHRPRVWLQKDQK